MYYFDLYSKFYLYICVAMEKYKRLIIGNTELTCQSFSNKMPIRLEQGGLFLCQSGHADILIDLKRFHITVNDMVVAFPHTVVQVLNYSKDCDGIIIGADLNFFTSIQISDKPSYYLYIKENPCISLKKEEWDKIIFLYNMLLRESSNMEHPFRQKIDESIMKIITYEIAAIYFKRKPISQQPRSRNEKSFQQFIFSLFNNVDTHRTLEFYATEQSITPRHLSMVVKQMSGITAGEWIVSCTIANIKSKLQDDNLSITNISDEMNFPNPSFFSQYFKKYTGISPKEYRKNIRQ